MATRRAYENDIEKDLAEQAPFASHLISSHFSIISQVLCQCCRAVQPARVALLSPFCWLFFPFGWYRELLACDALVTDFLFLHFMFPHLTLPCEHCDTYTSYCCVLLYARALLHRLQLHIISARTLHAIAKRCPFIFTCISNTLTFLAYVVPS